MGKRSGSARDIPRLRPNSIGSLRQQADKTDINSVAVPHTPYGGSINWHFTMTLRIPHKMSKKEEVWKEEDRKLQYFMKEKNVSCGHSTHTRSSNLTSIAVK
ncbi:hypothetical protein TNCV_4884091 [Trichonephila clavipes]|nr:hypothetical protein TNCV_4884091 [Trichonephila clavipes]